MSTLFSLSFTPATSSLVLRGTLVLVRRILRRGTLQGNAGETSDTQQRDQPRERPDTHTHTYTETSSERDQTQSETSIERDQTERDKLRERLNTQRDQHRERRAQRERPNKHNKTQTETKTERDQLTLSWAFMAVPAVVTVYDTLKGIHKCIYCIFL